MSLSKSTIPHFYLRCTVDAAAMISMRRTLPFKPAYNDIVIKAVAMTLNEIPQVNVSFVNNNLVRHPHCNVGLAVNLDNGLIVPVVASAQTLSLARISALTADLITRARTNKLSPDEIRGGTFTVTSLGTYPIEEFGAIINPPEAAILAVGKITEKPVAVEGKVVVRPEAVLTLSVDHRIIDGVLAAQFLTRIKELLESGYPLMA
jgi:pyruvate dehydrogenase E2 component (dihydrolipoamide acetyltransferase)